MSCPEWEHQIALDAGGDLEPDEARRLHEHLEVCPDCRRLVDEMRENQQALGALGEEELALGSVRERVLARIDRPRRFGFAWAWGIAAAVAVAGLVIGLVRTEPVEPPQPRVAVQAPHFDLPPVAKPKKPLANARGSEASILSRDRQGAVAEPMVVKLLTPDPDVVIYWLIERKAGTE